MVEDIDVIIQLCSSTHWAERKDGLTSLTQYLSEGKYLTQAQLKVRNKPRILRHTYFKLSVKIRLTVKFISAIFSNLLEIYRIEILNSLTEHLNDRGYKSNF